MSKHTSWAQKQLASIKLTPRVFLGLMGTLSILLVSLGLFFGLQGIRQQQDIRQQAAENKAMKIGMESRYKADPGTILINLQLNTLNKPIVGAMIKGRIHDAKTFEVKYRPRPDSGLETLVSDIEQEGNDVVFRIYVISPIISGQPVNTQGKDVTVATLEVLPSRPEGVRVSLAQNSTIEIAGDGTAPLEIARPQTFTVDSPAPTATPAPTPTITPQPTSQPTSQPSKKGCNESCSYNEECGSGMICHSTQCRRTDRLTDATCGSTPDLGIHRSCNEYCSDSSECASQYSCYFNRCRLPQNLNSDRCVNPTPRPVVVTTSGTGGVIRTATPRPTTIPVTVTVTSSTPSAGTPRPTTLATASSTPTPSATPTVRATATPKPRTTTKEEGGSPIRTILIVLLVLGVVGAIVFAAYRFLLGSGLPY
jgi:hypothetical protein